MTIDWHAVRAYVLARLQETTTWRGLIVILAVLGAQLDPAQGEAIVLGGLLISGLVAAAFPDRIRPKG